VGGEGFLFSVDVDADSSVAVGGGDAAGIEPAVGGFDDFFVEVVALFVGDGGLNLG